MSRNSYCDAYIHMLKESIILVIMMLMMSSSWETKST